MNLDELKVLVGRLETEAAEGAAVNEQLAGIADAVKAIASASKQPQVRVIAEAVHALAEAIAGQDHATTVQNNVAPTPIRFEPRIDVKPTPVNVTATAAAPVLMPMPAQWNSLTVRVGTDEDGTRVYTITRD